MRLRTELCFGLALVVAALALGGVPASAIETQPGAPVALASLVTPADWRARCHRWRIYCDERYPAGGWRYRRCLAFHACVR